jgi:hypothetical protein
MNMCLYATGYVPDEASMGSNQVWEDRTKLHVYKNGCPRWLDACSRNEVDRREYQGNQ